jgi:hypothetical protein
VLSSETEAADEDVPAVESAAEEADDFTEEVLDEEEEVSAAFDSTIYVSLAGVDVLPLASLHDDREDVRACQHFDRSGIFGSLCVRHCVKSIISLAPGREKSP